MNQSSEKENENQEVLLTSNMYNIYCIYNVYICGLQNFKDGYN